MIGIFLFLIFGLQAQAYIPSAKMILERVGELALKRPLAVEQELTLVANDQNVTVRELWLFEEDNSVRLLVRGEKDLKDQIVFQNLYTDNQRTTSLSGLLQTQKMARPLFERVFFIKNTEALMKFLVQQGVVGEEIFKSQNFKKTTGPNPRFQYMPENFLRLGRVGGGVTYIFGPQPKSDQTTPGFWVEQDQFNILKLRSQSGEEMRASKAITYSRGARWPKEMSYAWMNGGSSAQAQVQIIGVRQVEPSIRQIFQKNSDKRTTEFERHTGRNLVEEFYQKFR
jgi:hypothetical protein